METIVTSNLTDQNRHLKNCHFNIEEKAHADNAEQKPLGADAKDFIGIAYSLHLNKYED